jgi:hypothetical protein
MATIKSRDKGYFEKDVVLGYFDIRVKFDLNDNFIEIEFLN